MELGLGNRRSKKSCLTDSLRWGYTQFTAKDISPPLSEYLKESLQIQISDSTKETADWSVRIEMDKSKWLYTNRAKLKGAYRGRKILVLIDNGTGSDGELMTYWLASLPGTTVAGINSFGVMEFTQLILYDTP